jgi:hypothetical protein
MLPYMATFFYIEARPRLPRVQPSHPPAESQYFWCGGTVRLPLLPCNLDIGREDELEAMNRHAVTLQGRSRRGRRACGRQRVQHLEL